jgi:Flp pilus assembly protein TadD
MRCFPDLGLALAVGVCAALTACGSSNIHEPSLTADAQLQVAEAADASGDSELAISKYSAAAASEPSNIGLQLRCADALARYGKITQARQLLTERLRTNHDQPDLIRALALVDLVAGAPTRAIAQFDQILAVNPADTRTLADKAVALDLQGQHPEAQAIYRQVLAARPNDPAVRNNLAISMMLEGHIHQALQTLAPMQDAETSPPRLKVNLGVLFAATGDLEHSRQLLGDRASDADLSALTQVLKSSAGGGRDTTNSATDQ